MLGPNGGGKTTLFRTVLGLLEPHGGQHSLEGDRSTPLRAGEIARRIGYVPQGHTGVLRLHGARVRADGPHRASGHLFCARPKEIGTWPSAPSNRSASRTSPTSRSPRSPAASASSRWWRARSRRSRSCWCSTSPPRASTSATRCACCERIAALAGSGISILFSSHDPDHAFLCARRALLLAEGRVLEIGAPRDVIRPDTLQRLYGVSVQVMPLPGGVHTCLPVDRAVELDCTASHVGTADSRQSKTPRVQALRHTLLRRAPWTRASAQPNLRNLFAAASRRSSSTCGARNGFSSRRFCSARQPEAGPRAQVEEWKKTLPRAASVVVYCVHGHEVSQNAAKALGARYLEGGIEGWRENGGDLFAKPKNVIVALGHPRAAEDRPHRLPLAGAPLRRSRCGVSLCARGRK